SREGGVLQRAWDGLRTRLGRAPAARASSAEAESADAAEMRVVDVPRSSRRPRYRNLWVGLVVLGGLAGVFVALAAWQMGAFGPGSTPLAQLRQRLGIGPAAPPPTRPPAPVTPTPPVSPTKPPAPSAAAPSTPTSSAPGGPAPANGTRSEPPTLAATPPAPARPAAAVTTPAPSQAPAPSPPAAKTPAPTVGPTRFAVELGPFPATTDAERVERQLTQAGLARCAGADHDASRAGLRRCRRRPPGSAGRPARRAAAAARRRRSRGAGARPRTCGADRRRARRGHRLHAPSRQLRLARGGGDEGRRVGPSRPVAPGDPGPVAQSMRLGSAGTAGAPMLGKLLVVGVLVVGAFVLSQSLMRASFSYTLGALAAVMLFGLVLLRNDFGIYVVTFSMLLSPEFTAGGGGIAEGRTIMVRSEDFVLIVIGL